MMNQKNFVLFVAFIFALVFLAHALRLIYGWELMVNGYTIPLWVSWIGVFIAAAISSLAVTFYKKF